MMDLPRDDGQAVVSARQLMRGAFLIARSAATQLID
jgi:hypothetical protein